MARLALLVLFVLVGFAALGLTATWYTAAEVVQARTQAAAHRKLDSLVVEFESARWHVNRSTAALAELRASPKIRRVRAKAR